MIKAYLFDWGDTIMRDFPERDGPACNWDELIWIPGAEKVLKSISKDKDCYIASNSGFSDTILMIKALERMDASRYFMDFFTSVDLGFEKPDIRFYTAILRRIACLPQEVVMIGNNYKKDIIGAKDAGMLTIYFNESNFFGEFEKADRLINHMDQLVVTLEGFHRE